MRTAFHYGSEDRYPRGLRRFQLVRGSEAHAGAAIHHHMQRGMMLFAENFLIRLAGARGGAPIHGADIVARLIGAHFLEIQPAPQVRRACIAGMAQKYFPAMGAAVTQRVGLLDQGDDFIRRKQGRIGGHGVCGWRERTAPSTEK